MKRLAILLSAVSLGSGCIISTTCDSGTLWVDWTPVNASGSTTTCSGLSRTIVDVDVLIDGVVQNLTPVACTDRGLAIAGVSAGTHEVMVAGYNGADIVARDLFQVDVCGDTSTVAYPGEGILDIQPTNCLSSSNSLTFSITDVTMASPYVIWSQLPGSTLGFTCGGGIQEYVPLGYYDLGGLEETNASGSVRYSSLCGATKVDVTSPATVTHAVTFSDTTAPIAACF